MTQTLGQAIGERIDQALSVPNQLTTMHEQIARISTALAAALAAMRTQGAVTLRQQRMLEAISQKNDLLENASKQQTQLTEEHYSSHVVEPIARRLFLLIDLADQVRNGRGEAERDDEHFIAGFRSQIVETLQLLGIEEIQTTNDQFDAAIMRPARICKTDDPIKRNRIREIVRPGFRRGERVMRELSVTVYKYQPASEPDAVSAEISV